MLTLVNHYNNGSWMWQFNKIRSYKKGNTVIDFGSGSGIDVLYLILQYFAADILRGSLDPSEYRQPVMTLLFLKRLNDTFEEMQKI